MLIICVSHITRMEFVLHAKLIIYQFINKLIMEYIKNVFLQNQIKIMIQNVTNIILLSAVFNAFLIQNYLLEYK